MQPLALNLSRMVPWNIDRMLRRSVLGMALGREDLPHPGNVCIDIPQTDHAAITGVITADDVAVLLQPVVPFGRQRGDHLLQRQVLR